MENELKMLNLTKNELLNENDKLDNFDSNFEDHSLEI